MSIPIHKILFHGYIIPNVSVQEGLLSEEVQQIGNKDIKNDSFRGKFSRENTNEKLLYQP